MSMDCLVREDLRLTCSVVSESPGNWGFGEAAVQASAEMRSAVAYRDGRPTVGTSVRVPVRFDNPEEIE